MKEFIFRNWTITSPSLSVQMSQWWNLIRDGETDVDFDIQAKKLKILRQIRKEDLVETYKKVNSRGKVLHKVIAQSIASNTTSRFVIVAYGQQHMRRQRISGYQPKQDEGQF